MLSYSRRVANLVRRGGGDVPSCVRCTPLAALSSLNSSRAGVRAFSSATDESLSITDNRTQKSYTLPIKHKMIAAKDLLQIKRDEDAFGLRSYDPAYMNTANATSKICYIDGENAVLEYRGYPIEQLAEKSNFMEVSFLLLYGELPKQDQLNYFTSRVMSHSNMHSDLHGFIKNFRHDAHPMGMIISSLAAMSTLHPESNPALAGQDIYADKELRNKQIHRLMGAMPTISAAVQRHREGRDFVPPSHQTMTYAENLLYMLDRNSNVNYRPHPRLARVLDILFTLHADHEMNCSTSGMRHLASSGVDVTTALAGATSALYGPLHGGANEAVLRMLEEIGSIDNIPSFLKKVKDKKVKLMGFGHRVYKKKDPRAKLIKNLADEVFDIVGKEPMIELASALEKAAAQEDYFQKRNLYPNVDFYSGLIYRAMGFPTDFFPVLFAIPRTVGWLAHWNEFLDDNENKIVRPRQNYVGYTTRNYTEMSARKNSSASDASIVSADSTAIKRGLTASVTP